MDRKSLLQASKPILFSTQMVIAILEGRKTVTRRVIKPKHKGASGIKIMSGYVYDVIPIDFIDGQTHTKEYQRAPFKKGDYLYVRETWNISNMCAEGNKVTFIYRGDKSEEESARTIVVSDDAFDKYDEKMYEWMPEWRPSIHMPKEAARIFLKVTDVRVERLQDITEEQALAEGVPEDYPMNEIYCPECHGEGLVGALSSNLGFMEVDCHYCDTATKRFSNLWNSTIKKADLDTYGWKANPWVWVIEFERVEV